MYKFSVICSLLIATSISHAATFCVGNGVELQNALSLADSNNQDDLIKLETGTYISPNSGFGFAYQNNNENYDLEISGGWTTFLDPCNIKSGSAENTLIDGENLVRALVIRPGGTSANIKISSLTFINGYVTSSQRGGGLNIETSEGYDGIVSIENNFFINNLADYDAALSIARGTRINVKNNLFIVNEAESGYTIGIVHNDAIGVYFTNNTVISNTGAGLRVSVSGTSQTMIANNLFWDNDALDMQLAGNGVRYMYHNDISFYDGVPDFEIGNFSEEPEFDGGFLDFTPALSSSMINSGYTPLPFPFPPPFSRNWNLGSLDVLGGFRVQDNRVDIGAFEAAAEPPIFADGFE